MWSLVHADPTNAVGHLTTLPATPSLRLRWGFPTTRPLVRSPAPHLYTLVHADPDPFSIILRATPASRSTSVVSSSAGICLASMLRLGGGAAPASGTRGPVMGESGMTLTWSSVLSSGMASRILAGSMALLEEGNRRGGGGQGERGEGGGGTGEGRGKGVEAERSGMTELHQTMPYGERWCGSCLP